MTRLAQKLQELHDQVKAAEEEVIAAWQLRIDGIYLDHWREMQENVESPESIHARYQPEFEAAFEGMHRQIAELRDQHKHAVAALFSSLTKEAK